MRRAMVASVARARPNGVVCFSAMAKVRPSTRQKQERKDETHPREGSRLERSRKEKPSGEVAERCIDHVDGEKRCRCNRETTCKETMVVEERKRVPG